MAGACGQGDLSEGEVKREKKRERWGGVKQQGSYGRIIKRILAHLDQHHWVIVVSVT